MATLSCRQPAFRRGEEVRRPCVERGALLLCPIMPLIYPDDASPAPAQMVQHRLGDFETHTEALQPVARVRRRSCSHQPETPDAVSSADLAFDQPLKGVLRSPGKTSASFARWRAPWTSPGLWRRQ